jgi:hypothetical integral membrane protein (TIGR02206 family)
LCVAVCFAVMFGTAELGRRWRRDGRGNTLRLIVGWLGVAYWIGSNAWWVFGPQYKFAQSLPLQVCDITGLIGPVALLTGKRWLRAVLYFWGLSLSIQGFVQPVVTKGAAHVEFWLFWANHTVIVGTALFDVIALGFRPRLKDFVTAVWASMLYLALIVPFDVIFKVNYGYVGPDDPVAHHKTLVDVMGPWPWRILPVTALGIFAMWLLYVPWWFVRRRKDRLPRAA